MAQVPGQRILEEGADPPAGVAHHHVGAEAAAIELDRGAHEGLAGDHRRLERADVAVDILGGGAVVGRGGDDPHRRTRRPRPLGEEADLPALRGQPLAEGAELRRKILVREEDAHARSWKPPFP